MDSGFERIWSSARAVHTRPPQWAVMVGLVCADASVLRVVGRMLAGPWPVAGDEGGPPAEDEHEDANRALRLMPRPNALLPFRSRWRTMQTASAGSLVPL